MRIDGKINGKFTKQGWASNQSKDGQSMWVEFTCRCDVETCETIFGSGFAHEVAFAGMVEVPCTDADGKEDGSVEIVHMIKDPKPSAKVVMEMHKIKMLGKLLDGLQPTIANTRPIQGEQLVDIFIRIPIPIEKGSDYPSKVINSCMSGKSHTVEFSPKQGDLPLEGKAA